MKAGRTSLDRSASHEDEFCHEESANLQYPSDPLNPCNPCSSFGVAVGAGPTRPLPQDGTGCVLLWPALLADIGVRHPNSKV